MSSENQSRQQKARIKSRLDYEKKVRRELELSGSEIVNRVKNIDLLLEIIEGNNISDNFFDKYFSLVDKEYKVFDLDQGVKKIQHSNASKFDKEFYGVVKFTLLVGVICLISYYLTRNLLFLLSVVGFGLLIFIIIGIVISPKGDYKKDDFAITQEIKDFCELYFTTGIISREEYFKFILSLISTSKIVVVKSKILDYDDKYLGKSVSYREFADNLLDIQSNPLSYLDKESCISAFIKMSNIVEDKSGYYEESVIRTHFDILNLSISEKKSARHELIELGSVEQLKSKLIKLKETYFSMEQVESLSGINFEKLIYSSLTDYGYQVNLTQGSNDGGVDIELHHLSKKILIQCKRYKGYVSPSIIRDLIGAIKIENANGGIIITTGTFSADSILLCKNNGVLIIDSYGVQALLGGNSDSVERYINSIE